MTPLFEETLIEVWRQAVVENAKTVELGTERFPVWRTPKRGSQRGERDELKYLSNRNSRG